MSIDTVVTRRLGLSLPVFQGPFGGGLSTVSLVAAVSNAGGLGSYGAHLLKPDEIVALAAEIRKATARPFALNLWVTSCDPGGSTPEPGEWARLAGSFQKYYAELGIAPPPRPDAPEPHFDEQVEAVLQARPAVLSFVFGIPPTSVLEECRRRGIVTMGAATTVDEAVALELAGVDWVLATGSEAGGHRPSFLKPAEESLVGTMALVPQLVDRVSIPVVAAGGMGDARGVAAALALGASAAQLGTAFLACEESGTSPLHREELTRMRAHDTVLSRAFTGRLARFIRNDFVHDWEGRPPLPYPLQGRFALPIKQAAAAQGRRERMSLYAGQGAPLLRHRRAADLMTALARDLRRQPPA